MDQLQWEITRIEKETEQASTFFLRNINGPVVTYKAGQFLTFIFPHSKTELRRSFSFSSTPGIDQDFSVTVKRIPNGEISRLFLDKMKVGDRLKSIAPSGRFTIETDHKKMRQIFFIAAGSGITPIFSLLKKILVQEPGSLIVLIDQNHSEADIIFSGKLKQLELEFPAHLKWINLLSNPINKENPSHRLTNDLLETLIHSNRKKGLDTVFYLCGPGAFMRMAEFTLKLMGFSDGVIRKEHFTIDFIPPPPLIVDVSAREVHINLFGKEISFTARYPKTILQSALDHKVNIPYSCRGGRCSTCMAKCVQGKVKMSINEVLTAKDLEEGWILTCVGYAETDLKLAFSS